MAVQAQYPSNVLLLNRSDQERQNMEYSQAQPVFFDESTNMFFSNGGSSNPRKRGREPAVPMAAPPLPPPQSQAINLFSLQPQLQTQQPPSIVSTGLRLAFEDQHQHQHQHQNQTANPRLSSFFSEEIAAQINQHKDRIDQFLQAQGEELRRAFAERRERHHRALLLAAEQSAARRLREKEAEVERAARRSAELEDRLVRLRSESVAWQSKAMAGHATASALQAQLHQVAANNKRDECGESPAEDAESAHIDPGRVELERTVSSVACRACRGRPVSVVLLPCRHLSLCGDCDVSGVVEACPVCRCVRTGSVQVFLS